MVQEFKVIIQQYDEKLHRRKTRVETIRAIINSFEEQVNEFLRQGWRLINCVYDEKYLAFVVRDIPK